MHGQGCAGRHCSHTVQSPCQLWWPLEPWAVGELVERVLAVGRLPREGPLNFLGWMEGGGGEGDLCPPAGSGECVLLPAEGMVSLGSEGRLGAWFTQQCF